VRLVLVVGYDGQVFHGAARQPGLRTVAGSLERAASIVAQSRAVVRLAGRTDAGVHARAQVIAVSFPEDPAVHERLGEAERLAGRLERLAGPGLVVRRVAWGPDGFDPRRFATWRHYLYRLSLARSAWAGAGLRWTVGPLDVELLAQALAGVRGELDATALCRAGADGGYRRTVHAARVWVRGGGLVDVSVVGSSFCHEFVRRLVGNAVAVAAGRRSLAAWREAIDTGRRDVLSQVAPPWALTLWRVGFDAEWRWSEARLVQLGFERDAAELDPREEPTAWWSAGGSSS